MSSRDSWAQLPLPLPPPDAHHTLTSRTLPFLSEMVIDRVLGTVFSQDYSPFS